MRTDCCQTHDEGRCRNALRLLTRKPGRASKWPSPPSRSSPVEVVTLEAVSDGSSLERGGTQARGSAREQGNIETAGLLIKGVAALLARARTDDRPCSPPSGGATSKLDMRPAQGWERPGETDTLPSASPTEPTRSSLFH